MRIFANPNYNFIKWRWHALIASVVIIWAGVATIFLRGGLPLGIDFTGGTAVVVQFEQPTPEDVIRKALDPVSHEAVVQQYGDPAQNEVVDPASRCRGRRQARISMTARARVKRR